MLDITDFCEHCRKELKGMKEITYFIPTKYLNLKIRGGKPIAVRAWETAVRGLIVQRPIASTRRGEVHLTHKPSGAILVFAIKGPKTAATMARRLKRFPVNFALSDPAALYRNMAKFTDRQVRDFRKITGMKGDVDPVRWRAFCLQCARTFSDTVRTWQAGAKRSGQGRRGKGGRHGHAKG